MLCLRASLVDCRCVSSLSSVDAFVAVVVFVGGYFAIVVFFEPTGALLLLSLFSGCFAVVMLFGGCLPLFCAWLLSLDIFDNGASSLADSDLRVFHALLCLWIFLIVITMY
jgi:hypothetical protein